MKNSVPVVKNENYIIDIETLGYGGEGIGKVDNFTVFVKEALEGERVQVKIIKTNKNFAFGKLINIIEPSEYREEPVCKIYNRCGGCQLQHLNYKEQLNFKRKRVEDCIERIGKLKIDRNASIDRSEKILQKDKGSSNKYNYEGGIVVHNTIGMDNPYRYRNKVQLPVGRIEDQLVVGFYSPRSHDIIDMKECYIQHEVGDKVVALIKQWLKNYNIPVYDEKAGSGLVRHIMVRKAFKTGETMIVLVTSKDELPHRAEFIELMRENIKDLKSIVQNINPKNTNVILGEKCKTLWGKDTIVDTIGEFKFNISPLSFFQVNSVQTEVLYNKALEYSDLQGNEIVFDAYCGTGTISLFLAQKAKKVYGVEIIPEAIENAKVNARQNNIDNVEFIVGEAEKVIPEIIDSGVKADVVVVDPPRKGCEKSLLEAIAKMKPDKIVYVSCDPGTLARDLGILDGLGYRTLELQPVDMFPMTGHVETVVMIVKK
ncbi:23S rRNA (uracil(1939)-C(5))-methyltransferase RlmD [Clostridium pasteurianum]|uniref:23S rRNA (Uracil-5-)-methyltransferase RumA n=1 Tax=Clostridium pasteurianum BC1 TaxID=86416 RepID=R4K5B5_CLOPA|nr:23S rRNA (uracil(1939)-C(5))-methyltransferase RlmD [Clostridium pasteurianum]AGK98352.1 23S rRNA (uracil-5-)-methyltransferase RumA [Clostridium pasteurianum BC1]